MQEDNETDVTRHDGLLVDYSKFGDLTKEVLKNANVLRQKSINSPTQGLHTGSRNTYMLSSMRSRDGSRSPSGGAGLSIPPMSARMSSPAGSTSNHLVLKKIPETPPIIPSQINNSGSGNADVLGPTCISKQRPFK